MISLLYPWMYFDMAEEENGGGDDAPPEDEEEEYVPPDEEKGEEIVITEEEEEEEGVILIQNAPVAQEVIDVSAIPGNKYISSFLIFSTGNKSLIEEAIEGNIPGSGVSATAHVIGSPGGKFYLNITDIDDDEVFDLSNVTIPVGGKYIVQIYFPPSNVVNKYKINLRAGDGTRITGGLPTTDPMWVINQYANPTITFSKTTGTASGVTYTGDDVTLTTNAETVMGTQTNPFQSTRLKNGTSISLFGEFNYTVTAAKSGALVYIKTQSFDFTNSTVVTRKVTEKTVGYSDIIKLDSVVGLFTGMEFSLNSHTKTKLYNIDSYTLKLSDSFNLLPGMLLDGDGGGDAFIVSVDSKDTITVSEAVTVKDKVNLTFSNLITGSTIKTIDTSLKQITLEEPIANVGKDTLLSFSNNEMRFTNTTSASNSGSASTTLTNAIKLSRFGTKDVTYTLTTDDIFTLTPNAFDQRVIAVKETAIDINVLALDTDSNAGSKTPSTIRNPVHGAITGSYGSGDGTITYTPAVGFTGEDSFSFKVNDGTTDSDTKTVFITVNK